MGASTQLKQSVSGYSIDSRSIQPGDLFFALRGDNHDGHAFAHLALEKGAAAVVVDRDLDADPRFIRVDNTLRALQAASGWACLDWQGKVIGVTGSAGKTTTKDTIASMLSSKFPVGRTVGNFNNHVGLPISILRLPDEANVAVLEYGMNHAGEIRELAQIAQPSIAVVTNAGYAHIEYFESVEEIALAKRELVESLPEDGVAILNTDDERVIQFASIHPGRTLTYGFDAQADFRATNLEVRNVGSTFRVGDVTFETKLTGRHSVRNILAGLAVASLFDVAANDLVHVVGSLEPGKMRGERIERDGFTIINDCYNSNPDAVRSMLEALKDVPARRHVAVLGEMLELGRWSESLHRDAGHYAVRCGITVLVGIRGGARFLVEGATEAGLAKNAAYFFDDPVEAGIRLKSIARPGDAILFKGSRGTRVEKALEKFLE